MTADPPLDDGGPDADLAPRSPRPPRSARRRWLSALIGVALVVTVVGLVLNLVNGSLFFYNADEAIERRSELGDERFTLQGSPIDCTIVEGFDGNNPVVAFSVTFGGATIDVVHFGDPAELFQPDVGVVLDGAWARGAASVDGFHGLAGDGWHFASDRMRVKHDNDYINDENYDEKLTQSAAATGEAAQACGA